MVFDTHGMTIYHGLGSRPYRTNATARRIPSSITVYKGLGGHPSTSMTTQGQVGHGLGGMFRSLSKAVMPAAKSLITRAVAKGSPKLLKAGTRKLAKVAQALKTLTEGKRGINLLKSVGKTQLLKLAKRQHLLFFKAGLGLLSDLASNKDPKTALKKKI